MYELELECERTVVVEIPGGDANKLLLNEDGSIKGMVCEGKIPTVKTERKEHAHLERHTTTGKTVWVCVCGCSRNASVTVTEGGVTCPACGRDFEVTKIYEVEMAADV